MADLNLLKEKSLATIDAANTILQNYPDFKSTSTDRSLTLFSTSSDPLSFIIDIIKHTEGYDALLDTIAKYLVFGIEPLEAAVKTLIITHLRDFFSCSVNPYLTDEILRDGIAFNLGNLDLTNTFELCPLDSNIGQYYYFGIESDESETPDDLNRSQDFNALLWYMRNRSIGRQVWYGSKNQKENCNKVVDKGGEQLTKQDGIITLEYSEFFQTMKDAEGNVCYTQVPMRDCIHVFIGNAAPIIDTLPTRLSELDKRINDLNIANEKKENEINDYNEKLTLLDQNVGDIGEDEYEKEYNEILTKITEATIDQLDIQEELENLMSERSQEEQNYIKELETADYRPITENHYYHKTLMQFNTDLVMSMNIFDSKVIVAQILENLTGNISIDLNLNYSRKVIQEEVLKMVLNVIESDETAISDCFFSFSNENYDAMLRKSDLQRAGVYSNAGRPISNDIIDSKSLLSMLNDINPESSEEEQISIFTRLFNNISESISTTKGSTSESYSLSLKLNLLEELLTQLATAICMSIVSPKLYLIIAINLKIMGQSVDFSLKDFIQMYRQLLVNLIRMVRNMILQYFVTHIREILLQLAKNVSIELIREQVEFYTSLLQQCIGCFKIFKFGKQVNDWELGTVTADIVNDESDSPKNAEC